jgi:hypothetical protein
VSALDCNGACAHGDAIEARTKCSAEEHLAIKERVEYFMIETTGHQTWAGLLTGQCVVCSSTLALQMCVLACGKPCPTTDALPFGEPDDVAHAECVIRLNLRPAVQA